MKSLLTLITMFVSLSAVAGVSVYKYDGSKFNAIAEADVEAQCAKNFVFRNEHKNDAPKYLGKEIIKATFTGKLSPSLSDAMASAKAANKCLWVNEDEAKQLK